MKLLELFVIFLFNVHLEGISGSDIFILQRQ